MARPTKENAGKLMETKKEMLNFLAVNEEARHWTNTQLAEKFKCHQVYISKCLNDLRALGFISMQYTSGTRGDRTIEVLN